MNSYSTTSLRPRRLDHILKNTWTLLPEAERTVLRRLAIFPASFGRDAARRITGASVVSLMALIDRAVLHYVGGRYSLHPVVHRYVRTRLEEDAIDFAELQAAHRNYYLALLVAFEKNGLSGSISDHRNLAMEVDQIDAAWRNAVAKRDQHLLRNSIEGLFWFSLLHSDFSRCLALMQSLIEAFESTEEYRHDRYRILLATAHSRSSYFLACLNRQAEAIQMTRACQETEANDDDKRLQNLCLFAVAQVHYSLGEYDQALDTVEEILAQASLLPTRDKILILQLGIVAAIHAGKAAAARKKLADLQSLVQMQDSPYFEAHMLAAEGYLAFMSDDFLQAKQSLIRAIQLFESQVESKYETARCYSRLGWVHVTELQQGSLAKSESAAKKALSLYRFLGNHRGLGWTLNNLAIVHIERLEFSKADNVLQDGLTHAGAANDRDGQALLQANLGDLYFKTGDYRRALHHFEKSEALSRETRAGHAYLVHFRARMDLCLLGIGEPRRFEAELAEAIWHLPGQSIERYVWPFLVELLANSGRTDDAKRFALTYFDTYRPIENVKRFDIMAWLAQLAYQEGDIEQASEYVEAILAHFEQTNVELLIGAEGPFRICCVCYRVLVATDDERAQDVLRAAGIWLRSVAAAISDLAMRRSFLADVPAHRDLIAASAAVTDVTPDATSLKGLLTPRESEILQLIACGLTNQQIADQLAVSKATVNSHVTNIYNKINARNRVEMLIQARSLGLVK